MINEFQLSIDLSTLYIVSVRNKFTMLSDDKIFQQLPFVLRGTDFGQLGEKYEGKVRDNYTKDGKRVLIVTDRLSAFDRIITLIPFKGQVLNQIAKFWFEQTKDICANHAISFPDPNVVVAKECKPVLVEMVVRGYLTGVTSTSVWTHYMNGSRNFCGNELPDGLKKDQKLPEPIITPSTKAAKGGHDESVSREEVIKRGVVTAEQFDKMAEISMALYKRGVEIAAKQGVILVDTKYEFGIDEDGNITLIDEIHTPDSSRFWLASVYEERFEKGIPQENLNKEYLREWLKGSCFAGDGEVPEVPDEVRVETAKRYIDAYEKITGLAFEAEVGDVNERMAKNLGL